MMTRLLAWLLLTGMRLHLALAVNGRWPREWLWLGLACLSSGFMLTVFLVDWVDPVTSATWSDRNFAIRASVLILFFSGFVLIMAKRWHDLGLSGWTTIHCFIPRIGSLSRLSDALVKRGLPAANDYGEARGSSASQWSGTPDKQNARWLFLSWRGRLGRQLFWTALLTVTSLSVGTLWLGIQLSEHSKALKDSGANDPLWLGTVLRLLLLIQPLFAYSAFAIVAKRWHDLGKSSLWTLIAFVPVIGSIKTLLDCGFLPGDHGPNGYGAPVVPGVEPFRPQHSTLWSWRGMAWLLFDPRGRVGRKAFWWYHAALVPFSFIVLVVVTATLDPILNLLLWLMQKEPITVATALVAHAGLLFFTVLIWSWLAVMAKRWHDAGKSGWMSLIACLPVLGSIAAVVGCGMAKGTPGDNAYGPAPEGPAAADIAGISPSAMVPAGGQSSGDTQ